MVLAKYVATLVYAGVVLFAILAITSIAANFLGGDPKVTGAAIGAFAQQLTALYVVLAGGAGVFFLILHLKGKSEDK